MNERKRNGRGVVGGVKNKVKEKVNDLKKKIVTSVRNFSGIFLTMHLASCYSFKHTLNSCFVLCCKQFLKKDAICLCIKRGHVNRGSFTFLSTEGNTIDPMYCTVYGNNTKIGRAHV